MFKSHNVLNELSIFFKRHKAICIILLACVLIVIKFSKIPVPNWLPNLLTSLLLCPKEQTTAYEWMSLINGLSFAFVTSVITYVIIQYIPARRKAHNAFLILKKEFCGLYSYMSYLISMYLYEIHVEKSEDQISLDDLSSVCSVEINDIFKDCRIQHFRNGETDNTFEYGYNLYQESKKYVGLVNRSIERIKDTTWAASLDAVIVDTISAIENNWFLNYLSLIKKPDIKTPSYRNVILNFDKGFYELIKCHRVLSKLNYDLITYMYSKMSDEEIKEEKENRLFRTSRINYTDSASQRAITIVNGIIALEPSEERLRRSEGVLLEMLVHYDSSNQKDKSFLCVALRLAEYIKDNETKDIEKKFAQLNVAQIKKRLNTLSEEDISIVKQMANDSDAPNTVILGASIISGDYKKADDSFQKLSEEEKDCFIQFPIYRLWQNPPVEPNPNPRLFTVFEA